VRLEENRFQRERFAVQQKRVAAAREIHDIVAHSLTVVIVQADGAQYAAEHSQAISSGVPILALDMYEHAYHMDFGANAKAYVDTFLRNVDWPALGKRYEDAAKVSGPRPLEQPEFGDIQGVGVEEVKAMMAEGQKVQVIDVRPRAAALRGQDIADGAQWRDPEQLQQWIGELSKSEPVVVYCAYGFHVGCKTAIKLREAGFDAKYMNSGHSGWKAVGYPLKMNP
jgi:Fe-Mn family superoxide dismutase